MVNNELFKRSKEIILQNQAPSGAYLASPNFNSYQYSWLRDGSFIAHAMDQVGETESAISFYRWVDKTIKRHAWKVDNVINSLANESALKDADFLHTRYTIEGEESYDDATWGNFQIDGYGTWLWSLGEHVAASGDVAIMDELAESIRLTVRYLCAVWKLPNYDCWEEHPDQIHTYSLGAVFGGLSAVQELITAGLTGISLPSVQIVTSEIRKFILKNAITDGMLIKQMYPPENDHAIRIRPNLGVDASLIALGVPYHVFEIDDPTLQKTVAKIETDLYRRGGGVYRYRSDTYYGGGEWILLAAWLGWFYALSGEREKANDLLEWIEEQADDNLDLPEQVSDHVLFPRYIPIWEKRWGAVAKPLLWSHAMYLILRNTLAQG
jgi:GH15 family glucan-1,4-alpha-glucosidase